MVKLKQLLKPLVQSSLVADLQRHATAKAERRFARMSPAEVFSEIYRKKLWGSAPQSRYCSGQGSHHQSIVAPYIAAVQAFLGDFPSKPDAVDLGCGDFNVGSQLRHFCRGFVATDVVESLIARNARKFEALDVKFECVDIISDDLPPAEVAFLRQVAQHLTNAQIAKIVPKLHCYRWIVVSEHLPVDGSFDANLDKALGSGVRVSMGSGVVLTKPPFDLKPAEEKILCSVRLAEMSGIVQTVAYRMA